MSRDVAVVRAAAGLDRASSDLATIAGLLDGTTGLDRERLEVRNMTLAAAGIVAAATARLESRGAHFRSDYPETDPALTGMHLVHAPLGDGWRFGALADVLAIESVPSP